MLRAEPKKYEKELTDGNTTKALDTLGTLKDHFGGPQILPLIDKAVDAHLDLAKKKYRIHLENFGKLFVEDMEPFNPKDAREHIEVVNMALETAAGVKGIDVLDVLSRIQRCLEELKTSPDLKALVGGTAAEILRNTKHPDAVRPLAELLRDRDETVRAKATRAVGEMIQDAISEIEEGNITLGDRGKMLTLETFLEKFRESILGSELGNVAYEESTLGDLVKKLESLALPIIGMDRHG